MSSSARTLATGVVVVLASWSCGSTGPDVTPEAAEIVVSPASSTLSLNAQLPLQAQVHDGSGTVISDAAVTWTVQDPRIVSISSKGIVTGLAVGTSRVAANALGKSGLATITVNPPPTNPGTTNPGSGSPGADHPGNGVASAVATVTVTAPANKVKAGSTLQLVATATDSKGNRLPNQSFYWSSSNTGIATVSTSGLVTGKKKGDVTITAQTSQTGGKSGSLRINVK